MPPTIPGRHTNDRGFTLMELMVAMGLLSVLMVILTTTIVKGMQMTRSMGVRLDNINQGQLGMNAATKAIRTAVLPDQLVNTCVGCGDTALITATSITMTFYANLNNTGAGPSRMAYLIEQDPTFNYGNLVQTAQAPHPRGDGSYDFCVPGAAGCTVSKRIIARGVPWPATPTFLYYDFNGDPITSNPLTAADLAQVNSIDIALKLQTNVVQTAAPTNTIVQRVQLPNANTNVLVQPGGTP
jgi:prepilin-type N-terminal cleavage/methylation domain-containing protein